MPCKAKITQVNESKIPSLGMDVTQLAPGGERASEGGCVTRGQGWGLGREVQAAKRRAKNQEMDSRCTNPMTAAVWGCAGQLC